MWGAWAAGALPAASSLCPRHTQPGPLALPVPLCSGGRRVGGGGELLRREVAVEMEEAQTLGSGPQAAGGPHCPSVPLRCPSRDSVQQLPGPWGSFSSPGYCARCRHRVSAGARPQTLLPSLYVTSHLGSQCPCHFSKRLTLTTRWSPGVTPTVATPRVPESFLSHPHPNGCLFPGFDLYPLCS